MSNDDNPVEFEEVELPHNAWIDGVTGTMSFAIDRFTVTFEVHEFLKFSEQIEDIAIVLKQMIETQTEECPTCGTTLEATFLTPPTNEDYN